MDDTAVDKHFSQSGIEEWSVILLRSLVRFYKETSSYRPSKCGSHCQEILIERSSHSKPIDKHSWRTKTRNDVNSFCNS
ncbi:uncharacterized protein BJ212DRAFT_1350150 [Suillus subaureus]|uniref:Uncharacterized protein n=1 Tax=Suillus subaureus TaxID=48587 RepID=A0A9P7EDK4_9AGAM|nr:uncharacterized protein BJ212DRAFT_1350150 [Suillus subaureus]KAG1817698.1 hypothetical protein BJ212DRAFT_1350150 [Suillus subaureus]